MASSRRPSIAICAFQTLFTKGGAELQVTVLEHELKERGYPVEVVRIPFAWAKADLLEQTLLWRLIKVEADLVIATNFPSYFVKHDNKVVWLNHQHRQLYELYGTPYSAFGSEPGDAETRHIIAAADARVLGEARRVFTTSLEAELRRRVHAYGLEDRVRFAGFVDDPTLVDLYARCRAVFYAPFDEDYGYVTLEAFHARKPVVTTPDSGGVLEFVDDGVTGLVADTDPAALAGSIDRLGASVDLCRRLGETGHERIRDISWDDVIARLVGEPS